MSSSSLAIAFHHSRARGTAKILLLGIADHDGDGGAWPSMRTLCRYAGGVDERTAQKALAQLVRLGEVIVHVQAGGTQRTPDHRRPNLYQFTLRCPDDCDRSKQHKSSRETLFDRQDPPPAPVPPPGTSATPPPGTSATPPPGTSATRTTQENNPEKDLGRSEPVTTGSAREAQPVDKPLQWASGKPWCSACSNTGWLPPVPQDPDTPRPCIRCKPHLRGRNHVKIGVTR